MSVTCCPLSSGDECAASFSCTNIVKARKQHRCVECNDDILPGTRYERSTGMWDGNIDTYKTCLSCVEIRNHFACNGWLFGRLWEDLQENFFPDMKAGGPCMEGLSPEAKARLFDLRMKWVLR